MLVHRLSKLFVTIIGECRRGRCSLLFSFCDLRQRLCKRFVESILPKRTVSMNRSVFKADSQQVNAFFSVEVYRLTDSDLCIDKVLNSLNWLSGRVQDCTGRSLFFLCKQILRRNKRKTAVHIVRGKHHVGSNQI